MFLTEMGVNSTEIRMEILEIDAKSVQNWSENFLNFTKNWIKPPKLFLDSKKNPEKFLS